MDTDDFGYWKKSSLILSFFVLTPAVIAVCLFSLFSLSKTEKLESEIKYVTNDQNLLLVPKTGVRVYASLPDSTPAIGQSIGTEDARSEIIKNYLAFYYSPLEPYANLIVEVSDIYSLDYRILVAIAQQESNLCKKIPTDTYNCWGWGIHSAGTLGFDSFEHGIATVAKGLKDNYIDEGYSTVEEIMSRYTPHSNGSWANGVNEFLDEIENQ